MIDLGNVPKPSPYQIATWVAQDVPLDMIGKSATLALAFDVAFRMTMRPIPRWLFIDQL